MEVHHDEICQFYRKDILLERFRPSSVTDDLREECHTVSRYYMLLRVTNCNINYYKLLEKPAEAGGAPLGARLKLCEGDTRIHRIRRAIIIIDELFPITLFSLLHPCCQKWPNLLNYFVKYSVYLPSIITVLNLMMCEINFC